MLTQDLVDLPLEVFGGYVPALMPTVVPPGGSPMTQDCDFPEGGVTTRGGLFAIFGPGNGIPSNATINGLKTYMTPQIAHRLMVWDSAGNFYKESPDGTLTLIAARPQGATTLYQSTTLFGREYQAFYAYADPLLGMDIPRQYDDTNWDRVSQVGPGAAPNVQDEAVSVGIVASPNGIQVSPTINISSVSENGNTVTVQLAAPVLFLAGDPILIAGVGGGYDQSATVLQVFSSTVFTFISATTGLAPLGAGGTAQLLYAGVTFTSAFAVTPGRSYTFAGVTNASWDITLVAGRTPGSNFIITAAQAAFGNSGGGTLVPVGNVGAGKHQVTVSFITRQGYITMPGVPPTTWTAAGSKAAVVTNIPTGPANVIARLLMFTPVITPPATTGSFYSLPNGSSQIPSSTMLIGDNTTTTVTVDFTDVILIAGFQANYLFTQIELGECASANGYNSRMVWCGERNKVGNLINLTFDGGWGATTLFAWPLYPLGWTPDPAFYSGGGSVVSAGLTADWQDGYLIRNAAGTRGKITQNAFQDYLGTPIIRQNTSYRVRVRLSVSGSSTGTLHINLQSTSQAFTTVGLVVSASLAPTVDTFYEYDGPLTDVPLVSVPSDLLLQVYMAGNGFGGSIRVDSIEPYPTTQPYNFSTARFSHSFNPESYDGVTGAIQIRPNDGQQLHASFPIRGNLYFGKDHYLCYVTDDGVNEPSSWPVNEVSATIGICGPNAVDWTEEWAVFAERSGLYIIWGSDPIKITPEIQQDASNTGKLSWNDINWDKSQSIWVRIDRVNKQILVGVPLGSNQDGIRYSLPNVVFMLDYKWLEGAQDIANSPMVTYSAFTGKVLAHGRGRRWMVWNIKAASMTFAERSDGTAQPFFGNSAANGKLYQQKAASLQASDDGVAINSSYSTYYSPSHVEEQIVQLGAHRKLLGYLKWRAFGSGILAISITTAQRTTALRGYILGASPTGDGERGIEISGERFSIMVSTNTVGAWFRLEQLVPCIKKHPTSVVRGMNV